MPETLYAPSVPLTPEPLASVRAKRRAGRRNLGLALKVRSPFTVGGYILVAFLLPTLMAWTPGRLYYALAVLGLVTLWRAYLYLDARLSVRAFSAYEIVDGEGIGECNRLLATIPEGERFRSEVLAQGRFYTRLELRQIRQRAEFLNGAQTESRICDGLDEFLPGRSPHLA